MKKVIKLTEADLTRIIKKVIQEQATSGQTVNSGTTINQRQRPTSGQTVNSGTTVNCDMESTQVIKLIESKNKGKQLEQTCRTYLSQVVTLNLNYGNQNPKWTCVFNKAKEWCKSKGFEYYDYRAKNNNGLR